MFGQTLPMFNIKGKSVITTISGGIITVIIYLIMITYSTIKFVQLSQKHNPNVSQYTEKNFFDSSERVNLNEINFRLAFSVEGYHTRQMKDDEQFVKYLVRIYGKKDG